MFLHFTFVLHVLHRSREPAEHPFDSVSVSLTRSVAVDRELPTRVAMIESVCSAAEAVFIEFYTLLEKTWAVGLPTRLLYVKCQTRRIPTAIAKHSLRLGTARLGSSPPIM